MIDKDINPDKGPHDYRILETDDGFYVEGLFYINEGWWLWPKWKESWCRLSYNGEDISIFDNPIVFNTYEEANAQACKWKNPKRIYRSIKC